jgi:hypothetical protein
MGDWLKLRPGLTANERGLPVDWFESVACATGFKIAARRVCMFGPLSTITRKLGLSLPYAKMPIVKLDWLVSEANHPSAGKPKEYGKRSVQSHEILVT